MEKEIAVNKDKNSISAKSALRVKLMDMLKQKVFSAAISSKKSSKGK